MLIVKCFQLTGAVKALNFNYVRSFSNLRNFNFTSLVSKSSLKSPIQNKLAFSNTKFPLDNIKNLKRDILIYSFERPLYKYLAIFGFAQLALWIFYGGFVYASLRNVAVSVPVGEVLKNPILKRINLGDEKYKIIITSLCVGVGVLTAFVCVCLPARLVRELKLCQGGMSASLRTYGSFGKAQHQNIPLKNISCFISRREAKSYIALKIKSKWFYFLIDTRGHFHDTKLFDYTVGTKSIKAY